MTFTFDDKQQQTDYINSLKQRISSINSTVHVFKNNALYLYNGYSSYIPELFNQIPDLAHGDKVLWVNENDIPIGMFYCYMAHDNPPSGGNDKNSVYLIPLTPISPTLGMPQVERLAFSRLDADAATLSVSLPSTYLYYKTLEIQIRYAHSGSSNIGILVRVNGNSNAADYNSMYGYFINSGVTYRNKSSETGVYIESLGSGTSTNQHFTRILMGLSYQVGGYACLFEGHNHNVGGTTNECVQIVGGGWIGMSTAPYEISTIDIVTSSGVNLLSNTSVVVYGRW